LLSQNSLQAYPSSRRLFRCPLVHQLRLIWPHIIFLGLSILSLSFLCIWAFFARLCSFLLHCSLLSNVRGLRFKLAR
jgi:hypothetical protein